MTEATAKAKDLCTKEDCEEKKEEGEVCLIHAIGDGSPAGKRWFLSCRYPNLNVTIRPGQMKTDTQRAIVGIYANFRSCPKPNFMQGKGKRERGSGDETDMNDSGKWGIFGPIMDPGPEPEDGFKDDASTVPVKDRMKAATKKRNREIIDGLRATGHYQKTQQVNRVDLFSVLAEVTWDPIPHVGQIVGALKRKKVTLGKDGKAIEEEFIAKPAPKAAADVRGEAPRANVPKLGKGGKTAAA